jgi:hypothetical protein
MPNLRPGQRDSLPPALAGLKRTEHESWKQKRRREINAEFPFYLLDFSSFACFTAVYLGYAYCDNLSTGER